MGKKSVRERRHF